METNEQNSGDLHANLSVSSAGAVRLYDPPFLQTLDIPDCAAQMEALHRNRVLALKAQWLQSAQSGWRSSDSRSFITKTNFDALVSMFRRYKEQLIERFGGDEHWLKLFAAEMLKADAYEAAIQQRIDELTKQKSGAGNFEIRERIRKVG